MEIEHRVTFIYDEVVAKNYPYLEDMGSFIKNLLIINIYNNLHTTLK